MDLVGPARFDVWIVALEPTLGSELNKARSCVVVSPDEANRQLKTVVIVPLTSTVHTYTSRVKLEFAGKLCEAAIDQVKVIDKGRLLKRLGSTEEPGGREILARLRDFFEW